MFSLNPVLPEEQILSTIYGKTGILHNYEGCKGGHGLSPEFLVGVLSSIPDPVFAESGRNLLPACGPLPPRFPYLERFPRLSAPRG